MVNTYIMVEKGCFREPDFTRSLTTWANERKRNSTVGMFAK